MVIHDRNVVQFRRREDLLERLQSLAGKAKIVDAVLAVAAQELEELEHGFVQILNDPKPGELADGLEEVPQS